MRNAIVIYFFFYCIPAAIFPQSEKTIIRSIVVEGNHAFTQRQLLESMASKPQSFFSFQQFNNDALIILDRYHRSGYYLADVYAKNPVISPDSLFADVVIQIDEGKQMTIGVIELEGNTVLAKDEILQHFDTRMGTFLDRVILESDIDRLIAHYEKIGYPFASVSVQSISPFEEDSSARLRIVLNIDEGVKVHINEIRVTGNKETQEIIIVRETGIRSGELFDQEKIEKIQRRLNRLNIFSRVEAPEFYLNDYGGGLLIKVQEGNTNSFDGILGYVPGNGSGDGGYLTGLVDVTMKNLFGTARKLNVHWQRDDRRSQEIQIRYVEPWVLDLPVDASGGFQQRQQDTLYVRRAFEGKAEVHLFDVFSLGGVFRHETVIPSTTTGTQVVSNSRTVMTGLEIHYDTRDDIISPTTGVNYRSDYLIGSKKIYGLLPGSTINDQITVQKVSLDAEFFVQTMRRQIIAVGLHGRQLTSNNIEQGDLYRFGGATSMRGYRENQFLGSRVAWTNTEYRFLLASRSYFFGFFDTGYYYLPGDDVKGISSLQRLRYGYGIGVRLETALGNMSVSFALGEGDSFSQAKIHIGLVNDF